MAHPLSLGETADLEVNRPLYQEHPLDPQLRQIRLLSLLPGAFDDDIKCDLHCISIDAEELSYEALSYTWGDAAITTSIVVSGHQFPITTNLGLALRHLRFESTTLVLWADAICINQRDDAEKSHQISIMGEIYSRCSRVYCWLGCDLTDSTNPFELFNRMVHEGIHNFVTTQDFDAVANVVLSDWWTRIWTYQEVVLPTSILLVWGHYKLSWGVLLLSLERGSAELKTMISEELEDNVLAAILMLGAYVSSIEVNRAHRLDISEVHYTSLALNHRLATNSKDKIVGLLGLLDTAALQHIDDQTFDYRSSVSSIYTYYFSKMLIHEKFGLRCFLGSWFNLPSQEEIGLPLWVPNFNYVDEFHVSVAQMARFSRYGCYDASRGKERAIELGKSQDNLFMQGSILSRVTWTKSFGEEEVEEEDCRNMWETLQELGFFSGSKDYEDYVRILAGNIPLPIGLSQSYSSTISESKEIISDFELSLVRYYLDEKSSNQVTEVQEERAILAVGYQIHNRAFFVTENNTMGICELNTQVGDEVCILYGGNVPFILRHAYTDEAVTPNKRGYAMVGSCYLHGFMHGEGLQAPYFDAEKEENFWFPGKKPYSSEG